MQTTHFDGVDPTLRAFIDAEIRPQYTTFDAAHGTDHMDSVVRRSLELARLRGVDINVAYAVAAYHDLGLQGPRATHHLLSGQLLRADDRLSQWFDAHQIELMAQAVEDHRASCPHPPRSIYGCIVSEADRDMTPETVVRRCIQYGLGHHPQLSREAHYERVCAHLDEKYSTHGYLKLPLNEGENARKYRELQSLIEQPAALRDLFDRLFAECTQG